MRWLICVTVLAFATAAHADDGSGSGSGSGSAMPPMGDDAGQMRRMCAAAMEADPTFAAKIIRVAEEKLKEKVNEEQVTKDVCTAIAHGDAQTRIATNERHVILAYAAMWLVAAGLVLFLWRRQMLLKTELAQLRRDLEAATKDSK
jgi:hypothetical protein